MSRKELGRVTDVYLGLEDHDIFTMHITFDFGGTGQSFGGYALDTWDAGKKRRVGSAAGADFILRILRLFGVRDIRGIVTRSVYVLRDDREMIVGLETPAFDGGRKFLVSEWLADNSL
jgi:hypothetical protein